MNRIDNIKQNIHSWLNQNIQQLIILDWGSSEQLNLYEFINELKDARVLYVYVTNETKYIRTYAQNLAAQFCKYDKICKLDSDVILENNFFENHLLSDDCFYVGEFMTARDDNEKSLHGNIYLHTKHYFMVNGYNEYIKSYGWDDSDFTIRLMLSGLHKKTFNYNLMHHLYHSSNNRMKNLINEQKYHSMDLIFIHKKLLHNNKLWNSEYKLQEYSFDKIENNYYKCKNISSVNYNFLKDEYKNVSHEMTQMVSSWKLPEELQINPEDIIKVNLNNKFINYYYDKNWQIPVITEYNLFNLLKNNIPFHYFAFPWANYIDNVWKNDDTLNIVINNFISQKYYLNQQFTIIQHMQFRDLLPLVSKLNIKYIFTPHKIESDNKLEEQYQVKIIPISLYPINSNVSLKINNIHERKYLTSFIGAYNYECYISPIRLQIYDIFLNYEDCYVYKTNKWHFDDVVYKNKLVSKITSSENYIQTLSESKFSLCPSGSGSNSIRLWESLSYGSIPVILSDGYVLPKLKNVNWEDFVIIWKERDIKDLYNYLKNFDKNKMLQMSNKGVEMFHTYFSKDTMHKCVLEYFDENIC